MNLFLYAVPAGAVYVPVWLCTSRWLCSRWRAAYIDNHRSGGRGGTAKAARDWDYELRPPAILAAVLCGSLWLPAAIILTVVIPLMRFVGKPVALSQAEQREIEEEQREERKRVLVRNTELEAENDRLRREAGELP